MRPLSGFRVLDLTGFPVRPLLHDGAGPSWAPTSSRSNNPAPATIPGGWRRRSTARAIRSPMPNRSKRSVAIDLKSDRGRELFLELAAGADLVIENFRPA